MKIGIYFSCICCLLNFGLFAQIGQLPIKEAVSPVTESIAKYGEIPVSYYTGVPSITIPVHTVSSGNLNLGVSLSYHAGGIRVDQEASQVGLGWSLNAGGMIATTKETIQTEDLPCRVSQYSQLYRFSFLDYDGDFVIDLQNNTGVSIKQTDLLIEPLPSESGFKITTSDGKVFLFTKKEGGPYGSIVWYLTKIESPNGSIINLEYTQASDYDYFSLELPDGGGIDQYQSAVNGIEVNGLQVTSAYFSDPNVQTQCPYIYGPDGMEISAASGQSRIQTKSTYLTKITYKYGEIVFVYEDRDDLNRPGTLSPKRLKSIIINRVTPQNTVRKLGEYELVYYNSDYNNQNSYASKRLHLSQLKQKDNFGGASKVWKFNYNNILLPAKDSKNKDHWGYYNGPVNNVEFNPLKGANREPNPAYVTAGMLESIEYPTGGKTIFEFESNEYSNKGSTGFKAGGGVRIKKITKNDGVASAVTSFDYRKEINGSQVSSGKLMYDLRYSMQRGLYGIERQCSGTKKHESPTTGQITYENLNIICSYSIAYRQLFSYSLQPLSFTSGPPVGYDKVTVYNSASGAGGKEEYEYINDEAPSTPTDRYILRKPRNDNGFLLKKAVFKYKPETQTYFKLSEESYQYEQVNVKNITYYEQMNEMTGPFPGFGQTTCKNSNFYLQSYPSSWNRITNKSVVEYLEGQAQPITHSEITSYRSDVNPRLFLPKQVIKLNSRGQSIKAEYKYADDFSSISPYDEMMNRNMLAPVIEEIQTNVTLGKELSRTKIDYQYWQNNALIEPVNIKKSLLGNPLEIESAIGDYDVRGNVLQVTGKDGITTSFIWGYDHQYLVAKVVGKPYSDVLSESSINLTVLNNPLTEALLKTELNKLYNVTGVLVSTYTYRPHVGMISETDTRDRSIFYGYDGFNRLSIVRDNDKKIIKRVCYNYNNQPNDCITSCALGDDPNWQNTSTPPVCEQNTCGNTGYQLQEQIDMSPCSDTYLETREIRVYNPSACVPTSNVAVTYQNLMPQSSSTGFVATYTNNVTSQVYTFNIPAVGNGILGCLPPGDYKLEISKSGNNLYVLFGNGCAVQSGTFARFRSVIVGNPDNCNLVSLELDSIDF